MTKQMLLFCAEPGCNRDRTPHSEYCIVHLNGDSHHPTQDFMAVMGEADAHAEAALEQMQSHSGSARFHELLKELGDLHDKKQTDYGKKGDPFANVRASEEWGIKPWVGAMIRLNDKVKRLQNFARTGKLKNESAVDSMKDIAVYAIIALVLYEQENR
jgi:hypothetical protein